MKNRKDDIPTVTAKKLSKFERIGLLAFVSEEIAYNLNDITMGTSTNNLVNLENTHIEYLGDCGVKLGNLSGVGLSEGNDVLLQFWTNENNDCDAYMVDFGKMYTTTPNEWNFNQVNITE